MGEADETVVAEQKPELPDGEYAIVEVMGHRTYVGRVGEVERFGCKLMSIEPILAGELLPAVFIGGPSIFQLTPCSKEVAAKKGATESWQLPPCVRSTLPQPALPSPRLDEDDVPDFLREADNLHV